MIPKHLIHLDSGGLDSTVMKYWLHNEGHKVHSLLIDYGQKYVQELEFARWHCHRLNLLYTRIGVARLRGSKLTDGKGTVIVPNRNAILLSLAVNLAVAAKTDAVTIAANKDDAGDFPDTTKVFLDKYNAMLRASDIQVEVCAPFLDKPKWQIAALAQELGIPLEYTWSCYSGGMRPCGKCMACRKRKAALNHR